MNRISPLTRADVFELLNIVGIDSDTFDVVASFPVPGGVNHENRGISIDFHGYIWSTSHQDNAVYRWHPDTGDHDTIDGFDFPYTYSDMTGFALSHAGSPEG